MSAPRPRVVFDCNVFLQAIISPRGPAASCLKLVESGDIILYTSSPILRELIDVLSRPSLRTLILSDLPPEFFINGITAVTKNIDPVRTRFNLDRDQGDAKYIELAIEIDADFIVTRDPDLLDSMTDYTLEAKDFRRRNRNLKIVDPVDFLRLLGREI